MCKPYYWISLYPYNKLSAVNAFKILVGRACDEGSTWSYNKADTKLYSDLLEVYSIIILLKSTYRAYHISGYIEDVVGWANGTMTTNRLELTPSSTYTQNQEKFTWIVIAKIVSQIVTLFFCTSTSLLYNAESYSTQPLLFYKSAKIVINENI